MRNVFIINAHEHYPFAEGKLNATLVERATRQLESRGYEVDTAEDGRRALALLEGGADPDAVLLDVMMPAMDGIETLAKIRELDDKLPVIMLSVIGKAATIVEAMQLGATDYITKPFEHDDLIRRVGRIFASVGGDAAAADPGGA